MRLAGEGFLFYFKSFRFCGIAALQGVAAAVDAGYLGGDDEGVRIDGQSSFFDQRIFFCVDYDKQGFLVLSIEAGLNIQKGEAGIQSLQDFLLNRSKLIGDDDELDLAFAGND